MPHRLFWKPVVYYRCLECGRMRRQVTSTKCWICGSTDLERVELVSPDQVDFLSTALGQSFLRLLAVATNTKRKLVELRLRIADRRRLSYPDTPSGPPEIITFGYMDGYIVPVMSEETDHDALYWSC